MYRNNQGILIFVKNPYLHKCSKYIDICYYFICNLAEKRRLNIKFIPTAEIVADRVTKLLQKVAFKRFKMQLGVVN